MAKAKSLRAVPPYLSLLIQALEQMIGEWIGGNHATAPDNAKRAHAKLQELKAELHAPSEEGE